MKKITFFTILALFFSWQGFSQFGCGSGVVITDGYTATGITTPGTGGAEDWNTNPTNSSISSSYWDDDVYLFEYTSGSMSETISMTIFTRKSWNGIGIFSDCTGDTFSGELDAVGSSSSSDISSTVSAIIGANTTVYIAIGQWGTPNDLDFDVTEFTVAPISCSSPVNVTSTNITSTAVDFNWGSVSGATEGFNWMIMNEGEDPDTDDSVQEGSLASGVTMIEISGLTPASAYDFYVQSNCGTGNGLSDWTGPISVETECAIYTPDYLEDFTDFLPICWEEAGSGLPADGPSDFGTSSWLADEYLNTGTNMAVNINIYYNSREEWLISPSFDLSGGAYELIYNVALTDYNNSDIPEGDGMGSDDEVQVLITQDNGVTWENLMTYNQASYPSNTGDTEVIDLSAYTGTVQFAFWATDGSVDDSEDYDFFIDDFKVESSTSTSTEDCGQEQFSNAFENGLFMEEGGQLLANDFIVSANTLNFSVDNITANIMSQGGIDSMDITFYEDNAGVPGTEIQTFEDVVPTSQDIIGDAFGYDVHEVVLDLPTPVDFAGDGVNAVTYWVQLVGVPTTAGTQMAWEVTTASQIGNSYVFDSDTTTEWTPATDGEGDGVFSITGQCEYIEGCLQPEALTASNITVDSVDLMWTEVGDATEWTIEYGASGFTLGDGTIEVDDDAAAGITITGLDSLTEYDFYVTANCTGDDSVAFGPLTVSTVDTYCQPMIDFSVEPITLVEIANISNVSDAAVDGSPAVENFTDQIVEVEQSDSYAIALEGNTGGGFDNFFTVFVDWNQNGLLDDASEVYEIGSITGSTGTDGQQATGTIAVPADAMIGETRMRVYKNYNSSVTDPCASNSYGQIEDYMVNVSEGTVNPCAAPSDIVVDPITDATADVSWTENGTAVEWEIEYGEPGFAPGTGTVVQDNDGTLGETLENLSPETTYDVYVRAICADGTQSDWTAVETFTTDEFSVNNSNFQNFSYYPNPVKANLSLKAGLEIEKVSVYNLLGQEVIVLNPNSLNAKIDLSRLQAGPYMLRVSINGDIKTFKVIKN